MLCYQILLKCMSKLNCKLLTEQPLHFLLFIVYRVGSLLYVNYIFVRFCIPVFQDFNKEHVTLQTFLRSILNCHLSGSLLLLIGFFSFLHCWLNAWAEMLCFGDRMFYKDWWNSTNFQNYYRTVSSLQNLLCFPSMLL